MAGSIRSPLGFSFLLAVCSYVSVPCGDRGDLAIPARHVGEVFIDDRPLPVEHLITHLGYPVETHDFVTADGYILRYHRIPFGKTGYRGTRGPVLLQHGYLGASSVWVLTPEALAFTLADAGFDVWLGNARGNTYSRRHVKYDPDRDTPFWDFSWQEMADYDMPAAIDYILGVTGCKQLSYIGHSMGTTMFFTLGDMRPDYMDKVEAAFLLAPVSTPWYTRKPLAEFLGRLQTALNWLSTTFNMFEVFPYSKRNAWLNNHICAHWKFKDVCKEISAYLGSFSKNDRMKTSLFKALQYIPAGSSYKTLEHLTQISGPGKLFRAFDNSTTDNKSTATRVYDLSKVRAPLYIYYAENDWLAVPEDVLRISRQLPDVRRLHKIADSSFGHLDFVWAARAKPLLYNDIVYTLLGLAASRAGVNAEYNVLYI